MGLEDKQLGEALAAIAGRRRPSTMNPNVFKQLFSELNHFEIYQVDREVTYGEMETVTITLRDWTSLQERSQRSTDARRRYDHESDASEITEDELPGPRRQLRSGDGD